MKKNLPIGISNLTELRNNNYHYVDKTRFVSQLCVGKYYFLSRPRRFGKSLFIDTLKQAFLGNKAVFKGLYLEKNWNWDKKYPVVHMSFGTGNFTLEGELDKRINEILRDIAAQYEVALTQETHGGRLKELIEALQKKSGEQAVILIDEYDKPVLDAITDIELAEKNRDILKGFYGTIKDCDAAVRFVLLTGVTKFSKAGLFSCLNLLEDISLDAQYADICGYTQLDLETEFAERLALGNVDTIKLKQWYNGYNFSGTEAQKVYNPFDILLFFSKNYEYNNYWFETGNPSFLIKLIQKNKYYFPDMENVVIMQSDLSSFDIDTIPLVTLLFQAGYLTIKESIMLGAARGYRLSYPNLEVKMSLNNKLTELGTTPSEKSAIYTKLLACLKSADLAELGNIFQSHFASIPHDWYRNNEMQRYEGFYASIIYSFFCALGYPVTAEDNTNNGQMDLTIILPDKILILEFKLKRLGDAASALEQIKNKKYPDKYLSHQLPIHLIGMSFDQETRNVCDFLSEVF